MPARLTAYLPECPAYVRVLGDGDSLSVGRDPSSSMTLAHASVSRSHAALQARPDGWRLQDLASKNGTFVDGERVAVHDLRTDCWLRFGDVYCEFEPLNEAQLRTLGERAAQRRASSAVLQREAAAQPDFADMLQETLRAAVELAGCERGFLLLGAPGDMRVRAAIGIDSHCLVDGERARSAFGGSVGAVARVLSRCAPVVVNDTGTAPWLSGRASVVAGGIRALACVPLLEQSAGASAPIGVLYADSRNVAARITELDVELLVAFVERMALTISARRAGEDLGALAADAVGWEWLLAQTGTQG